MRHVSKIGIMVFAVAVVAAAIATGCKSAPLRTESATSGIRAAEEVGASKIPSASVYLQLAKEELEHARVLAAKGKKDEAASMLTRAEADAELAVTLSHEQTEKTEAGKAIERARQLRKDNQLPMERSNP
jgi:hypothetical protein